MPIDAFTLDTDRTGNLRDAEKDCKNQISYQFHLKTLIDNFRDKFPGQFIPRLITNIIKKNHPSNHTLI